MGRYDHDLFAVVLPQTDLDLARRWTSRALQSLTKQPFVSDGRTIDVHITSGVASLVHDHSGWDDLLEDAIADRMPPGTERSARARPSVTTSAVGPAPASQPSHGLRTRISIALPRSDAEPVTAAATVQPIGDIPRKELGELLESLCDEAELRHLVAMLPGTVGLYNHLPGAGTPHRQLVLAAVLLLERHGLTRVALMHLREEYPRRTADIDRVAGLLPGGGRSVEP